MADDIVKISLSAELDAKTTANNVNKSLKQTEKHVKSLKIDVDLSKIDSDIKKITPKIKEASKTTQGFAHQIGFAAQKFALWSSATTVIMQTVRAIQATIEYTYQMDKAMVDLGKVVDFTTSQMEEMRKASVQLGIAYRASSVDIMKAFAEFGRQFKTQQEIIDVTKSAVLASKVTSLSAADAAKTLSTAMVAFNIPAEKSIRIVDAMNEVQNNYKITAEDLADSLGKVGNMAKLAGISMEELSGITTAIVSTTGISGSESGTAIKAMLARIYRVGEEGELDAGNSEKLLKSLGIAVRDVNGQFLAGGDILDSVNEKWKTWGDTTKMNVAQTIGGVYHYSKIVGLFEAYDKKISATDTALNSFNSSQIEADKIAEGLEGKLQLLKTSWESIVSSIGNSAGLKAGVDALTSLTQSVANLQEKLGGLVGLLVAFSPLVSPLIKIGGLIYSNTSKNGDATENYAKAQEELNKKISEFNSIGDEASKLALQKAINDQKSSDAYKDQVSQIEQLKQVIADYKPEEGLPEPAIIQSSRIELKRLEEQVGKVAVAEDLLKTKVSKTTVEIQKAVYNEQLLNQTIKTSSSELSNISDIYNQLNDGQKLSADTLLDLIQKYPEVISYIQQTNDLTLDHGKVMGIVFDKKKKDMLEEIDLQLKLADAAVLAMDAEEQAWNKRLENAAESGDIKAQRSLERRMLGGSKNASKIADIKSAIDRMKTERGVIESLTAQTFSPTNKQPEKAQWADIFTYEATLERNLSEATGEHNALLNENYEGHLKILDVEEQRLNALLEYYKTNISLAKQHGFEDEILGKIVDTENKLKDVAGKRLDYSEKINDKIAEENKLRQETLEKSNEAFQDIFKIVKDGIEEEAKARKDAYEEDLKNIEDSIEEKKKIYKDEIESRYEAEVDLLNRKKELLSRENDQRKYAKEQEKNQKTLTELQARYNKIRLDNSGMYESEKIELQEKIAEMQDKIEEDTIDNALKLQEQHLNDLIDFKTYQKDVSVKAIEDETDARLRSLIQMREAAKANIASVEQEILRAGATAQAIMQQGESGISSWASKYSTAMKLALTETQALIDKLKELMTANQAVSASIQNAQKMGMTLADQTKLAALSASWTPANSAQTHAEAEAIRAKYGYSGGASGSEVLPVSSGGQAVSSGTTTSAADQAIAAMKANSAAWLSADSSTRQILSAANKATGEAMGWKRDDASGIWYDASGKRAYATGGVDSEGGMAMLHGRSNAVETIFNATDGKKLFNFVQGLPSSLLNSSLPRAASAVAGAAANIVLNINNPNFTSESAVQSVTDSVQKGIVDGLRKVGFSGVIKNARR